MMLANIYLFKVAIEMLQKGVKELTIKTTEHVIDVFLVFIL